MIVDNIVEMSWNSNNKKYYVDKGYKFTKMYNKFNIKISDLNVGSAKLIKVKCDICEFEKVLPYREYNNSVKNCGYYACSQKCSNMKSRKTCYENYGVEFPIQNIKIKDKIKNTNTKIYGCEFPSQNKDIKEKVKQTCLINFGDEFSFQNSDIKDKIKETNLKKYGVENVAKSKYIYNKVKNTNLNRYGVECVFQSEFIKNKIKNTNINRYGFEYAMQNKDIMNKIVETQINRYGELWKKKVPKYNPNSIFYLDEISKLLNINIQHALNGGEKKIIRYWIDGYIEEYNICIEWDENHHKYNIEYDTFREDYLIENNDCKFVRINEQKFLSNIKTEIKNVVCEIKNLIAYYQ